MKTNKQLLEEKFISIGRNPLAMNINDLSEDDIEEFLEDEHFKMMFVPKDVYVKYYETALNSELGYTEEDEVKYLNGEIKSNELNAYATLMSIKEDRFQLKEKSSVWWVDSTENFKKYLRNQYEENKKTFI